MSIYHNGRKRKIKKQGSCRKIRDVKKIKDVMNKRAKNLLRMDKSKLQKEKKNAEI